MKKFFKGFVYAFEGIKNSFAGRNMRVHGMMAIVVVSAGLILGLSKIEWIIILILIGLVWAAEIINTSIEELNDIVRDNLKLEYSATKKTRDMAAGAVLVLAIVSTIIGLMIFVPKVVALFL